MCECMKEAIECIFKGPLYRSTMGHRNSITFSNDNTCRATAQSQRLMPQCESFTGTVTGF